MPCVTRVVIAGGGIGGLTLAHALVQRGIETVVLERHATLSEVGAGITIWQNALSVLDALGLGTRLRSLGAEPPGGVMATSRGRTLSEFRPDSIDRSVGRTLMLAFHRRDLQAALYDALPEGTVRFGSHVGGYRVEPGRVRVELDAGSPVEGDLLVGADGIASRVRAQLLGNEAPRYAGYTCWRGVTAASRPDQVFGELWGPGHRFGMVGIGGGRTYWFAVVTAPPGFEAPEPRSYLGEVFADYGLGVPDLIRSTPAEAIVHNDIIDRPPVSGWSDQRVTLLGDSVHATTPNMGQGAAMAIESAMVLARLLADRGTLSDALATYEKLRAPRTRWVTQSSWRLGKMAHAQGAALRGIRNLAIRWTPPSVQQRSLLRLLAYQATTTPL